MMLDDELAADLTRIEREVEQRKKHSQPYAHYTYAEQTQALGRYWERQGMGELFRSLGPLSDCGSNER